MPEAPMNKHGHERCCHDDPAEYHQAKLPRSQRDDAHSQAAEQTVQNDSKLHRSSSREPTQAKLLLTLVSGERLLCPLQAGFVLKDLNRALAA